MALAPHLDTGLDSERTRTLAERLECGEIVTFPPGDLSLPGDSDLEFLRHGLAEFMKSKNVSYHPEGDYLTGIAAGEAKARAHSILRERTATVNEFLGRKLPEYSARWRQCKVNARPVQEQGRQISKHSSNELIHVDAFPSGPTYGARPLRFFTNINATEPRVWKSAGLFPELYEKFARAAGLVGGGQERLGASAVGRAAKGTLSLLAGLGLEKARLIGTSPYDRAMKRVHDTLKEDDAFQSSDTIERLEFEPGSSWCCFSDLVSHGVISGQHVLVNTYYVPLAACVRPELAPFNVMSHAAR